MIYNTDKFYGNSLTESDAKKNRKLFILYVKKKVIRGATVIYVVVKISTGRNQIGDQGQSQTLAVTTKPVIERVVSNPYVSIFDEYRPSGLYMNNFERPSLISQHYSLYDSQEVINELRAGDSRWTQAAWLLITIWMLQQQGAGFQPVRQVPPPPHLELARNLLFGKPKPDQLSCRQLSKFDQQEFEKIDPYSSQVMSKENALALITKEYGTLQNPKFDYIDESFGLTAPRQQLAAKTYHAPSYKLEPELYGISQAQMKAINEYGLVGYVERGGQLPSSKFIDAYHQHVKTFYARNKSTLNLNGSYRGEPAIIVHSETKGEVLIFRSDTKEVWTPGHLRPAQMKRYILTGGIGKQKELPLGTTPPPKQK